METLNVETLILVLSQHARELRRAIGKELDATGCSQLLAVIIQDISWRVVNLRSETNF